jgi:hypothetical protein
MKSRIHTRIAALAAFGWLAAAACSSDENSTAGTTADGGGTTGSAGAGATGGASGGSGGATGGGAAAGGSGATGGGGPIEEAPCAGHVYECGDTEDNDDDGLIDSNDPDCLGPCDDTEDGYHPELPGWTGDACRLDCFWDTGNGPGNDGCHWDHHCDPLSIAPDYPPEGQQCEYDAGYTIAGSPFPDCTSAFTMQTQECTDYCAPLTPNGCDCFGCCELPAGSGQFVWLGSYDEDKNPTCTIATVTDPALCQPCTQVPGCVNDCQTCELCLGKTFLPPECFDPGSGGSGGGGGGEQCPTGIQACGLPGQPPCPSGSYCITGCCQLLPE